MTGPEPAVLPITPPPKGDAAQQGAAQQPNEDADRAAEQGQDERCATADGRTIRTPAITDLPPRDSNGAGDSFLAGLLAARLADHTLEQSLRMATITAALTVASADLVSADLSLPRVRQEYRQRFAAGQ